ncbi:MAG: metallophosphoesterase [Anaerolineales bacterium]|nr:metallophosphoesterase [Anaerolineales bacterium]
MNLVISCGDLPYYYLEYVLDNLGVPLFFVHGNHDPEVEISSQGEKSYPWGARNMHRKFRMMDGFIFLGFEGSVHYSDARYQYPQWEVWLQVVGKIPRLLWNKLVHGRYLDVLITHSPAFQVGDNSDPAHVGFKAYRWLIQTFKPRYHFHGHIHIYDHINFSPIQFKETIVVNACPYRVLDITQGDPQG